jgi:hypothetical protein
MRFQALPSAVTFSLALAVVPSPTSACEVEKVGAGVTLAETTPIADLLAHAEERVGSHVAVEGEVTGVCQMMGCWLELRAAEGGAEIRVKVDDGALVFPSWSKGKAAKAEGTVERLELSREDYLIQRQHEAQEAGEELDEASVEGDGPFRVYRIHGTGAEICR